MKYLITGITGQDGIHLTNFLLNSKKVDSILGISRSTDSTKFLQNLNYLNSSLDTKKVSLNKSNLYNEKEVSNIITDYNPDFIFNLSGPSSVYNSFKQPGDSYNSIISIFDNLINACIVNKRFINFFQPSSSEMFADNGNLKLHEQSKYEPLSPYAKAKYDIHQKISTLRNEHDWNINSGILFNHESEFRKDDYLFMKIINNAIQIKNKKITSFTLGSLDLIRDWSYAKDTTEAMYYITEDLVGDDYVIGSGEGKSIKELALTVFDFFDLDYSDYIQVDSKLLREQTPNTIVADTKKINNKIGWSNKTSFESLIEKCIKFKLKI